MKQSLVFNMITLRNDTFAAKFKNHCAGTVSFNDIRTSIDRESSEIQYVHILFRLPNPI